MKLIPSLLYQKVFNVDGTIKETNPIVVKTLAKFVFMDNGQNLSDAIAALQAKNPYREFASQEEYNTAYEAGEISTGEICIISVPDYVEG